MRILSIILFAVAVPLAIWDEAHKAHLFDKLFRRGRGIGEAELTGQGCYRKNNDNDIPNRLWYMIYTFKDPRISEAQRIRLIDDIFGGDSEHCPLGDDSTHKRSKVNLHALILESGNIVEKASEYLTPDMMDKIFDGVNLCHVDGFIGLIGKRNSESKTRPHSYAKTLRLLFNSDKVKVETYWDNFESIVSAYEFLLEGYYRKAVMDDKEKEGELRDLFLDVLSNPLVTEADIDRLCYSKYEWLRHFALKHPLCQPGNNVVVALLDASSKLPSD